MGYAAPNPAIKARASAVVDELYRVNQELGMLDHNGIPTVGLEVQGHYDGDYISIGEHEPVKGKRYFTVTVMYNRCYLMQPLTISPTLKSRMAEELTRLLGQALKEGART